MREGNKPAASVVSLRELVSEQELRALLDSDPPAGGDPLLPVLLLDNDEAEREALAAALQRRRIPVVATGDPAEAVNLAQVRGYRALVAAQEALPERVAWFVERIREATPELSLILIREPSPLPPPPGWRVVTRSGRGAPEDDLLAALGADEAANTATEAPPAAPDADRQALAAIETLLAARAEGRELGTALEEWAAKAPGIRGIAEIGESRGETRLRARAPDRGTRRRMLRMLLEALGEDGKEPGEQAVVGPFSLHPVGGRRGRVCALWHEDPDQGRGFAARLRPLLPLIERLRPAEGHDGAAARERFRALLDSRIHAARRHGRRLALLLLEAGEEAAELAEALRRALRGADWVEAIGGRVHVILDHPDEHVFRILGQRLEGIADLDRLRVAALAWRPGDGDAEALLERAERMLAEDRGQPPR